MFAQHGDALLVGDRDGGEACQLRLNRTETDLRQIVRDAVSMFPEAVVIHGPDTLVLTSVGKVGLRQSVLALLRNAQRYGGPLISVHLCESAASQIIAAEDDGPCLNAAQEARILERFFRGSNASGRGSRASARGFRR